MIAKGKIRVPVTLDGDMYSRLDKYAKSTGYTKSALIVLALESYLLPSSNTAVKRDLLEAVRRMAEAEDSLDEGGGVIFV